MKWVRDAAGRLPERPHYTPDELNRECEALLAARQLLRHVARAFDVSETAARVRLTHVGALTDEVPIALRSAFLPARRPLSPVR